MKEYKYRNRLRELRIARGWESMAEFTRFINSSLGFKVSLSTIHLIEIHKNENPYWQLVAVLSDYFGVTADYLMGRADANKQPTEEDKTAMDQLDPADRIFIEAFLQKKKSLEGK